MKVLSCKVKVDLAEEFKRLAEEKGESAASLLKKWVEEYVSRGRPMGRPIEKENKVIEGRPMVDAYHREEPVRIPGVQPDPEKLEKFKDKYGR